MSPEVSIIIPVYNNAQYLRECLDSAVQQTLREIEIICVNDGSTDDSLAIMREYAKQDKRITVIDKSNAGYGHTMNCGLDAAKGEYVAFLESDDSIRRDAYASLVALAKENSLDIIKGDYYELRGMGDGRELTPISLSCNPKRYNTVVKPLDEPWTFYMPMMNSLGLFRRKMLEGNHIRHNETPGAAHQDMGFWFQTFVCADSLMFIDEAFYEYRQDNINASMKSDKTTFSTLDEYAFIREFLNSRPSDAGKAFPIFFHRKFSSSMFSFERAELSLRLPFLRQLAKEFQADLDSGLFMFERFNHDQKVQLELLLEDVDSFYLASLIPEGQEVLTTLKDELSALRLQVDSLRKSPVEKIAFEKPINGRGGIFLSFVIPVYNTQDYVGELLDSILSQEMDDIEIICVDDGSEDNALSVLQSYEERFTNVRVLHQENRGQGSARNLGLRYACGQYVQFVDSDDKLRGDSISFLRSVLSGVTFDVLFFDGYTFYDSEDLADKFKAFKSTYKRDRSHLGEMTGSELFRLLKAENAYKVSPCMAVFSRSYLVSNDIFFPEGIIYEDNVFTLKAICLAQRAGHVNEQLYFRRIRRGSTTTLAKTAKNVRSYFEVYYQMFIFASQRVWDYATAKAIASEMKVVLGLIRKQFKALNKAQRIAVCTLPPVQETLMDSLVAQTTEQKKRESAEKKLRKVRKENKLIKASNSWRIGRTVTAPARVIKKAIKGRGNHD